MGRRGLLIDLDGVVYDAGKPVPGSIEAIDSLRAHGVPFRFVTNTTSRGRAGIAARLTAMAIAADPDEIVSPAHAAAMYLRRLGAPRCLACLTDDAQKDLDGLTLVEAQADWVVLGDLGEAWTYARMNAVLRELLSGARLMALGMSRYWRAADGMRLDVGPFAAMFQFATGIEPLVMGKPAKEYFQLVLDSLGLPAEQVAMVGDAIDTDVDGAQRAGMQGILVRTGKFRPQDLEGEVKPDGVFESLEAVVRWIVSSQDW